MKRVRVVVADYHTNFTYLDANGNRAGFEVDLLKDINKLIPEYKFTYETVANQLTVLDSGDIDLPAFK